MAGAGSTLAQRPLSRGVHEHEREATRAPPALKFPLCLAVCGAQGAESPLPWPQGRRRAR